MAGIISIAGSLIMSALKWWLDKQKMDDEMRKSYISFLNQLDQKGMANVANYLATERARDELFEQIKKDRLSDANRPE